MIFSARSSPGRFNNALLMVPLLQPYDPQVVLVAAAALGIGMALIWLLNTRSDIDWLPAMGLQAFAFTVILAVMVFPESLPGVIWGRRGGSRPRIPRPVVAPHRRRRGGCCPSVNPVGASP